MPNVIYRRKIYTFRISSKVVKLSDNKGPINNLLVDYQQEKNYHRRYIPSSTFDALRDPFFRGIITTFTGLNGKFKRISRLTLIFLKKYF